MENSTGIIYVLGSIIGVIVVVGAIISSIKEAASKKKGSQAEVPQDKDKTEV